MSIMFGKYITVPLKAPSFASRIIKTMGIDWKFSCLMEIKEEGGEIRTVVPFGKKEHIFFVPHPHCPPNQDIINCVWMPALAQAWLSEKIDPACNLSHNAAPDSNSSFASIFVYVWRWDVMLHYFPEMSSVLVSEIEGIFRNFRNLAELAHEEEMQNPMLYRVMASLIFLHFLAVAERYDDAKVRTRIRLRGYLEYVEQAWEKWRLDSEPRKVFTLLTGLPRPFDGRGEPMLRVDFCERWQWHYHALCDMAGLPKLTLRWNEKEARFGWTQ